MVCCVYRCVCVLLYDDIMLYDLTVCVIMLSYQHAIMLSYQHAIMLPYGGMVTRRMMSCHHTTMLYGCHAIM